MRNKEIPVVLKSRGKQKNNRCLSTGISMLFCGFILAGGVGIFAELPSLAESSWMVVVSGLVTCGLLFASRKNESTKMLVPALLLSAVLGLLFLRTSSIVRGILSLSNDIIERWNREYFTYKTLFSVSQITREDLGTTAIVVGILMGLFIGYAVWYQWIFVLSTVILFWFLFGFLLHFNNGMVPEILLFVGWMGIWIGSFSGIENRWRYCLMLAVGLFLLGAVGIIALKDYKEIEMVSSVWEEAKETVHKLRYGEDSLPEGNLKDAHRLLEKGDEENTLELSFQEIEEMYLRGFVGSTYDGERWKQLSCESYQGSRTGMLEWLEEHAFSPALQYASCGNLAQIYEKEEEKLMAGMETESFSVVNNGADRKYVYVPNTVEKVTGTRYRENQDWQFKAKGLSGAGSYEFQALAGGRPTEILTEPLWSSESAELVSYQECEAVYRAFVYDNYLEISEEQKEEINRLFFSGESFKKEWKEKEETAGIYSATSRIRVILDILAEYTESPEKMPEEEDFVNWFLKKSKKGNAIHFSTAAVLAYRTLGIPARYAEGYYVSEEQAGKVMKEGAKQLQLTEENGHAWVEIYVDGIGWCPVEVTPGFYHEIYSQEKIIDVPEEEVERITKKQQVDVDETFHVDNKKEEQKKSVVIPWSRTGILLLLLFLGIGLLFLLELQRFFRKTWRIISLKKKDGIEEVRYHYDRICLLFLLAGIQEDFRYPYKMMEAVTECFPDVKKEEYERMVKVSQQVIFGQEEFGSNERRILSGFYRKICRELYDRSSLWKKIYFRYGKCI